MYWVHLDGLEKHWSRARVEADIVDGNSIVAKTANVSAMSIAIPGGSPLKAGTKPSLTIDGAKLAGPVVKPDGSFVMHVSKSAGAWKVGMAADGLAKLPGLQGPIDDAFMSSFTIVRPTGRPFNAKTGDWANSECDHAIDHWRKQFRGEARVVEDKNINEAQIAESNLILFGDPSSNAVLAKIAAKLPIQWTRDKVTLGTAEFPSATHAVMMIYPNPLNPTRYVVLNSGFTFREYDYLNNARQVPKLPDFAVIDLNVPVSLRAPGGIVEAGFFDERWQLLPDGGKSISAA